MMESQRSFFVIGLLLVTFLLFQEWQREHAPQPAPSSAPEISQIADTPTASTSGAVSDDVPVSTAGAIVGQEKTIEVKTDVLDILINTRGGDIISAKLNDYKEKLGKDTPVQLLQQSRDFTYIAQSGLIGQHGPDASKKGRPVYHADQSFFEMKDGKDELVVTLAYEQNNLLFHKKFSFKRGSYAVDVTYDVLNNTSEIAQVQLYGQLKQSVNAPESGNAMMTIYRGPAYSTTDEPYEKYDFDDVMERDLKASTPGGWVAMLEHYFVSAWVAPKDEKNTIFTRASSGGNGIIGFTSQALQIEPGKHGQTSATLYVGPKDQDAMAKLSDTLDLTIDYGFLWPISKALFWLLGLIQSVVVNWGLAIIAITIFVKTLLYPLTKKQYVSMAKMRNLQPKMTALRERYGDDRQRMGQAMMELYAKEKVNPMGGCLPMLLQMPIFLALYWVFLESVELRHAEFFLWITDLSAKDPYYVLPVLFGASMWLMQKLTPAQTTDPMQQKMMQMMPIIFSIFFIIFPFPSGLVLYWLVSNLISIAQMLYIYRSMEKSGISVKSS